MLFIAQIQNSVSSGQLPPLPEGPDLDALRLLSGTESMSELWITLAALGLLAGIALVLAYLKKHSGKIQAPPNSYRGALDEIKTARDLAINDGDFATLCSGAVRRLLLRRFKLSQKGLTDEELTEKLPIEEEDKQPIREFLNRCESVKFANAELSVESRSDLSDTALRIAHTFGHSGEEASQ